MTAPRQWTNRDRDKIAEKVAETLIGNFTGRSAYHGPIPPTKGEEMRGLYNVIVVDPEIDEILLDKRVIAKTEDSARFKALKPADLAKELDDYDVIVLRLGKIRDKKEGPQEVVVVNDPTA